MRKIKRFFRKYWIKLLAMLGFIPTLEIIIKDDLSGLESFEIKVTGIYIK